jgi:hypothetical protein
LKVKYELLVDCPNDLYSDHAMDKIPKHERDRVRRDLLDYCHRDALAMVRLVETLEGLARVAP